MPSLTDVEGFLITVWCRVVRAKPPWEWELPDLDYDDLLEEEDVA